jgi:hypothetical protein
MLKTIGKMKNLSNILFVLLNVNYLFAIGNTDSILERELQALQAKIHAMGYQQMPVGIKPANKNIAVENKTYPFQKIDGSQSYYTLSNNQYPEIITAQSNLQTNTQGSLLPLWREVGGEVFGLSIDPLSEKFPSESPYSAMEDNPVNKIDPDGMATKEVTGEDINRIMGKIPEDPTVSDLIKIFITETKQYNDNDPAEVDASLRGSAILIGMAGEKIAQGIRAAISNIGTINKNGNEYTLATSNGQPLIIDRKVGVVTINNNATFTIVNNNAEGVSLNITNVNVKISLVSGRVTSVMIGKNSATLTIKVAGISKQVEIPY